MYVYVYIYIYDVLFLIIYYDNLSTFFFLKYTNRLTNAVLYLLLEE